MFWLCFCVNCRLFPGLGSLWGMAQTSSTCAASPLLRWRYHAPGCGAVWRWPRWPWGGHAGHHVTGTAHLPSPSPSGHPGLPLSWDFVMGSKGEKKKSLSTACGFSSWVTPRCRGDVFQGKGTKQWEWEKFLSPKFRNGNSCIPNLVKIHYQLRLKVFL